MARSIEGAAQDQRKHEYDAVHADFNRALAFVLTLTLALPPAVDAQTSASPPTTATPSNQGQPVFRMEEIDQIMAPIALYPDDLLAQVLMASTYPIEIVQAERWVSDPNNAKLKGDELANALEPQSWDPSVKSLVPFPPVLKMMSDKLDWTQKLGDAFLAQQADVMASVQRLRKEAQNAGTLKTTEQQTVVVEPQSQTVVIQPTNPEVVYVPTYNPSVAYGTWPYPSYPPTYYPPPPAYYPGYGLAAAGIGFATGVLVGGALWGWGNCNWGGNNVTINPTRYNNINAANIQAGRATQLSANSNNWSHDPSHRGGVAYRDPGTRQNYQRKGAAPVSANRDFRGYDTGQRGSAQNTSRASASTTARASGQTGTGARQPNARTPADTRQAGAGAAASRQPTARTGQASAFQGIGNGSQTRAQSARGASSRQSFASSSRAGGGARAGGARAGGGRRR